MPAASCPAPPPAPARERPWPAVEAVSATHPQKSRAGADRRPTRLAQPVAEPPCIQGTVAPNAAALELPRHRKACEEFQPTAFASNEPPARAHRRPRRAAPRQSRGWAALCFHPPPLPAPPAPAPAGTRARSPCGGGVIISAMGGGKGSFAQLLRLAGGVMAVYLLSGYVQESMMGNGAPLQRFGWFVTGGPCCTHPPHLPSVAQPARTGVQFLLYSMMSKVELHMWRVKRSRCAGEGAAVLPAAASHTARTAECR